MAELEGDSPGLLYTTGRFGKFSPFHRGQNVLVYKTHSSNAVFQHPVARHLSRFLLVKTALRTTFSAFKIN
jgi:hypothetical protein